MYPLHLKFLITYFLHENVFCRNIYYHIDEKHIHFHSQDIFYACLSYSETNHLFQPRPLVANKSHELIPVSFFKRADYFTTLSLVPNPSFKVNLCRQELHGSKPTCFILFGCFHFLFC